MNYFDLATELHKKFLKIDYANPNTARWKIKSDGTPVSTTDKAIEKVLIGYIKSKFPNDRIISEEGRAALWPPKESENVWAIDPLDGTRNYELLTPLYGSLIARIEHGVLIFGAAYLPVYNLLAFAISGKGAWISRKNGRHFSSQKFSATNRNNFSSGTVLIGGTSRKIFASREMTLLGKTYPTRIDFGAWSIPALISGKTSVVTIGDHPWDTLPSILLAEESGNMVTDWKGNPWTLKACGTIVAAHPKIHSKIIELLKKAY